MPVINVEEFPAIASVRVQVDWADIPRATHATVWRVDCVTGKRTQLRPYVAYNANGYLLLSCGVATFWDTEVDLDRCVRYCTQAQDTGGNTITTTAANIITDTFSRTVAAGSWGTSDSGQAWTIVAGAAAHWSVSGGRGLINLTAVNDIHRATISSGLLNTDAMTTFYPSVLATGGNIEMNILSRRDEVSNSDYRLTVQFTTTGAVNLVLAKVVNGAPQVILGTVSGFTTYVATTGITVRLQTWGSSIKAKAWDATGPEPGWMIVVTDTSITAPAAMALRSVEAAGNTNGSITVGHDNFLVMDPCESTTTVEVCSSDVMVPSSGNVWLKDPVRPCNNQLITLCWVPNADCVPGKGIFFARMEAESYASRTGSLDPVNSVHSIPAVRKRGDAETSIVLVTRTFTDRDALINALAAGSPMLWQAPPDYGIPDRYINIGTVGVARYQSDHRYEPRVVTLPYETWARPAGPTQGLCGTRVDDLCDIYSSWNALIAAGLTFQDLIDGKASTQGPGVDLRTWLEIETTYATWLAVETAPNTWETVREG